MMFVSRRIHTEGYCFPNSSLDSLAPRHTLCLNDCTSIPRPAPIQRRPRLPHVSGKGALASQFKQAAFPERSCKTAVLKISILISKSNSCSKQENRTIRLLADLRGSTLFQGYKYAFFGVAARPSFRNQDWHRMESVILSCLQ